MCPVRGITPATWVQPGPGVHLTLKTRYGLPRPSISIVSCGHDPDDVVSTGCIWKRSAAQSYAVRPSVMTAALEM